MAKFAEAVCESWEYISVVPHLPPGSDAGCTLSSLNSSATNASRATSPLQMMLVAVQAITPHSMQTKRCISNYNNFRSAHRLHMQKVNCHHQVALNAVGTASFDPRPAAAEFLKKDRRYREPGPDSYEKRDFVVKFFRKDGNL